MNDLIDRQAAIDAMMRLQAEDDEAYGCSIPEGFDGERAKEALEQLPSAQINVGDINKFIDSLEEIFADLREMHVDDSVCGLCEYDGAYIGQSGDWCNECPGFDRDDCFKLSDECRKRWIDTITKALPSAQPEQRWIPCSERLPKYGKNVLITNDKGNVSYGRFRGVEFWKEDGDSYWIWKKNTIEHVLEWMPLPAPYTGEGDE